MNAASGHKKARKIIALALLLGGLLFLLAAAALTFSAIGRLSENYRQCAEADFSEDFSGAVVYDDHLYAQLAYGIEILSAETDKTQRMEAFLAGSLSRIYERIFSAGVIYVMFVSAAGALFLYTRWGRSPKKHTAASLLYPLLVFLLFLAAVYGAAGFRHIPFPALSREAVVTLAVSVVCVTGGMCALGVLLRRIRYKTAAAVAAVPLVFALFMAGTILEGQLFAAPYVDSFDYVTETADEAALEAAYYDDEKNVLVMDGREYPPEQQPNPDRLTGVKQAGAVVFEALDPFSGSSAGLVRQFDERELPAWVLALYALKAVAWLAACALIPRRHRPKPEQQT